MTIALEVLRRQLDYTVWASNRLVDAAGALTADELTRDFGTADHNVLGTLVHIYAADRAWLSRVLGKPPARFIDPEQDMHLTVLQNDWLKIQSRWKEWLVQQTDDSIRTSVAYKDLKGNPYGTPIWQIVLHLVNHGTHHRGQVSGFLRAMDHKPPVVDLMAYYREGS